MKKLLLKSSFILIPLLTLIFFINFYKDPGGIINTPYEEMAYQIQTGKNIELYSVPSDWGRFHKAILEYRQKNNLPAYNIITWGSSRSSEITKTFFPNNTYFNCVIPSSNILDYVAAFELYSKYHQLPSVAIINIDPWSFYSIKGTMHNNHTYYSMDNKNPLTVKEGMAAYLPDGLLKISGQYNEKNIEKKDVFSYIKKYSELFSPSYFQSSFKVITRKKINITEKDYIKGSFTIRADGSYSLNVPGNFNPDLIEGIAHKYADYNKGNFYCDSCINNEYVKLLELLIQKLKEKNIKVIFFISPIHPIAYNHTIPFEKNLLEQTIRNNALKNNFIVVGSFNPHIYGLNSKDSNFLDEHHPTHKAVEKIFKYHQADIDQYIKK